MTVKKLAKVRVSMLILEQMLSGDFTRLCEKTTAPDDLTVLGVEQPPHAIGQWFYVICQSDTFRPIPEASEVPEVGPWEYTSAAQK